MKSNLKKLEEIIKINFKDKKLLLKSITHKSFNEKNNNEKLEFLGDRVLGLIISKKLIEIYPKEKEGIIDKKFANLVNKKTGPQHKPIFKTDVQIPNSKKVIGIGSSKKNAQQNAASKLLRSLKIL